MVSIGPQDAPSEASWVWPAAWRVDGLPGLQGQTGSHCQQLVRHRCRLGFGQLLDEGPRSLSLRSNCACPPLALHSWHVAGLARAGSHKYPEAQEEGVRGLG